MSNLRPAAGTPFGRGTQCTYQGLAFIVVNVHGDYRLMGLGSTLSGVTVEGRVLAHVSKLAAREHYVTIEPVEPATGKRRPRLCITEHETGSPVLVHDVEDWLPLAELREQALAVAARLGVPFREPTDELAVALLGVGV
ncbi:hypothetical protein ABZW11_26340 [Nonomuraea sp. NPDC004580]|uniref:hypothetical protein n=1 Tax=Nonomuraea sp. NPDC004580 TaxID=3154552 RepID=UPI0033BD3956